MYDLFLAGLMLSVSHVAVAYGAAEVWKLDYKSYLAVTVGVGLAMAFVLKVVVAGWRSRIGAVISQEYREGELPLDVLLFFGTLFVGGAASAFIVYRRYGLTGWAGAVAANWAASWLV
jgi:hypothetical protein